MYIILSILCIRLVICLALIVISTLTSYSSILSSEKNSPFECGFNPKFIFRAPFSTQFFLVALLFLIFDVELIILFPFLLKTSFFFNNFHFIFCFLFFISLLIGLLYEWNQKNLDWRV